MKAAGVLPFFTGIAVHDAWKPYDTFGNVAGHALCGAHVLRELVAVTETGTDLDKAWAQQAIDALLALDKAAGAPLPAPGNSAPSAPASPPPPVMASAHSKPSPVLSRADPGSPKPDKHFRHQSAARPSRNRGTYLVTFTLDRTVLDRIRRG